MYGNFPRRPWTLSADRPGDALIVAMLLLLCPAWALRADAPAHTADEPAHAADEPADSNQTDNPPHEMHFCWTNCFTLRFDDGAYRRTDGTDETWTVEHFDSATVVLHRHDPRADWNGFSTDVVYQGQVVNDRLVKVTVNGNLVPDVNLAWGFALDSLPGSNAERDRRRSAQAQAQALAVTAESTRDDAGTARDAEPAVDVEVSATEAPPPLLNYDQTPCPEDGYLWTPGYWSWGGEGYFWVPGAWLQPPRARLLWTPGYWAFMSGIYVFHAGYWGPHVGYYGGINYGYGYVGSGFMGGRWEGNSFAYNRAVSNLSARVTRATYSEAVVNDAAVGHVSYNGGPGGAAATPTAEERAAAAEPHMAATPRQRQIVAQSAANPELKARTQGVRLVYASTAGAAVTRSSGMVSGMVNAHGVTVTTASAAHGRAPVEPNTSLHATSGDARPAARTTATQTRNESDSAHAVAPKLTHAPAAKPHNFKQ
jgi:hypothetical protein